MSYRSEWSSSMWELHKQTQSERHIDRRSHFVNFPRADTFQTAQQINRVCKWPIIWCFPWFTFIRLCYCYIFFAKPFWKLKHLNYNLIDTDTWMPKHLFFYTNNIVLTFLEKVVRALITIKMDQNSANFISKLFAGKNQSFSFKNSCGIYRRKSIVL